MSCVLLSLLFCHFLPAADISVTSWSVRPEAVFAFVGSTGDLALQDSLRQRVEARATPSEHVYSSSTKQSAPAFSLGATGATPEWHHLSVSLGAHLTYSHLYTKASTDKVSEKGMATEDTSYSDEVTLTGLSLDIEPGIQWRPFSRHIFALRGRLSGIPLGDQDVRWETSDEGTKNGSGSFLAVRTTLALSYAYRILDRLEVGLEFDLNEPGLYKSRAIRAGGLEYRPGTDGGGKEMRLRLGWPIAL